MDPSVQRCDAGLWRRELVQDVGRGEEGGERQDGDDGVWRPAQEERQVGDCRERGQSEQDGGEGGVCLAVLRGEVCDEGFLLWRLAR